MRAQLRDALAAALAERERRAGRLLEIDEAVAALRKAIALDPKSAEPRAELAALYARQDKASDALLAAEEALKVDPRNQEANRILGSVLAALADSRQPVKPGDDVAGYAKRAMAALEIAPQFERAQDLLLKLVENP